MAFSFGVLAKDLSSSAVSFGSCLAIKPPILEVPTTENPKSAMVVAQKLTSGSADELLYSGDVKMSYGSRKMVANSLSFNKSDNTIKAVDGVHFQDAVVDIKAEQLISNTKTKQTSLLGAEYQFLSSNNHGSADVLQIDEAAKNVAMSEASFTTCPKGDSSWKIESENIELDGQDEWATATNSTIYVADVPVMWVPYLTFPLSDKRKSGLLFPEITSSSDVGFEYKQPIYWNISPNMDATFTPRYMSFRGTLLATEFRHLTEHQQNTFDFEYLGNDENVAEIDKRYFINWGHEGIWSQNWKTSGQYSLVSDDNYFNDFSSSIYNGSTSSVVKTGSIAYQSSQFDAQASLTAFDQFGTNVEAYRQLPRINLAYRLPVLFDNLKSTISSEVVYFSQKDPKLSDTARLHVEPNILYSHYSPQYSFEAETKLYQTFYWQRNQNDELNKNISRTVPSARIGGQINLERNAQFFDANFTQTLEPKIQYLYKPYRDQQEIDFYDTMGLRDDYYGLFRDQRFSGIDRIADANQITIGASSRFLNQNNAELFGISMGQIFYIEDSKVIQELTKADSKKVSSFAVTANAQYNHFKFNGDYQYSFEESNVEAASVLASYEPSQRKLLQLSYQYSLGSYDFSNLQNKLNEVNQVGVIASWPLSNGLQLIGTHYRDVNLNRSIESLAGVQYETCCWAVQLVYHRSLNANFPDAGKPRDQYDSGVGIQFEITGFGSRKTDLNNILRKSIFGYRQQ